ncbi:DMT family transporter [Desulfovibrio intestinalis]|uniref:Guanidinium exporter n=1 Tax=Desulfovibrio intestinalis TaxID=58621 RepID=A0A7W8FE91_9BACT|nr:SMR family transporter [Desulfovibrio intestinalis]MBB5143509.1 multidrug transporter EmrE-like cation transporter [Desulfovibrio intestinalis]
MLSWTLLFIASSLEIAWAAGLKYADSPLGWVATLGCVAGSFIFLVLATKRMEASIAYVLFVTLGAVGTYLLDISFFGKKMTFTAVAAIIVILVSIVCLKREEG